MDSSSSYVPSRETNVALARSKTQSQCEASIPRRVSRGAMAWLAISLAASTFLACGRTPLNAAADKMDAEAGLGTGGSTSADGLGSRPEDRKDDGSSTGTGGTFCQINDGRYQSEESNPANSCQSCQPTLSDSAWSTVATVPGCIAGGTAHTCALLGGGAWCWGANANGQLGNGSFEDSSAPKQVYGLSSGVSAVAAGFHHTCAIRNRKVACWGMNATGELGDGTTNDSNVPVLVTGIPVGVEAIISGPIHTCALSGGAVWCWGVNGSGQLGRKVGAYSQIPVQAQDLPSGIRLLAAGDSHTCASTDQDVWCWGENTFGQLGHAFDDPVNASFNAVQVQGISGRIRGLAALKLRTCALTDEGVQCWGSGPGSGPTSETVVISVLGFPSQARFIAGRMFHICGILSSTGSVMCLGDNSYGDLGNGLQEASSDPVNLANNLNAFQALASGDYHNCAIAPSGIWCWGLNANGQLGDGTKDNSSVPVSVIGLPPSK
jgi:hypothetical protein